ncbi:mucin 2, oligomeric mucus/gel-forming [Ceratobasidium sp. AG-Ba]|nr:mucin 2, oligomeric mucus/gel-forming [Ceratobasidium sp. AG-Ba]
MRLPSSSNIALATLALSPSLLSSPVFGAPTPDVGGLSPSPNTGYFAESPQPQTTDSPLPQGTPNFSAGPSFASSPTPPAAKIAGRRRSIKRRPSVKFRAVRPDQLESEVLPLPNATTYSAMYGGTTSPVLISPDGSVHLALPLGVNRTEPLETLRDNANATENHHPWHNGRHPESSFLSSPVPYDAPTFPPPIAVVERGVLSSTPSMSYTPALGGSHLQEHTTRSESTGDTFVGYLEVPNALWGLGLGGISLGSRSQMIKQELPTAFDDANSPEGAVLNPKDVDFLVGRSPLVAPFVPGLDSIPMVSGASGVVEKGEQSAGGVLDLPLGIASSLPTGGLSGLPSAALSNMLGSGRSNIRRAELPALPIIGDPVVPLTGLPSVPGVGVPPISAPIQNLDPWKTISGAVPTSSTGGILPIGVPASLPDVAPILGPVGPGADLSSLPNMDHIRAPIAGMATLPIIGSPLSGSNVPGLDDFPSQVSNTVPYQAVRPVESVKDGLSTSIGAVPTLGTGLLPAVHLPAPIGPAPIPHVNGSPIPILPTVFPDNLNTIVSGTGVSIGLGLGTVLPSVTSTLTNGLEAIPTLSSQILAAPTVLPVANPLAHIIPPGRENRVQQNANVEYKEDTRMGSMGRPEDSSRGKDFGDWVVNGGEVSQTMRPSSTSSSSRPSHTAHSSFSGTHRWTTSTATATKTTHSPAITPTPTVESVSGLERRSMDLVELPSTPTSVIVSPAHASLPPIAIEPASPVSSSSSCSEGEIVVSTTTLLQPTPVYIGGSPLARVLERSEPLEVSPTPSLRWCVGVPRMTTSVLRAAATGAPSNEETL